MREKSIQEHKYTSTGVKFWRHPYQMTQFRLDGPDTIISTHVAPEGSCNLNCSYCSVKKRTRNFRIELDVIKDYITKLMQRGLKAVILTGGGEPTLYPQINELVEWLKYDMDLSVALITNGTCTHLFDLWDALSWVRVSINEVKDWENRISLPTNKILPSTVVGCSYIDTGNLENIIPQLKAMLDKLDATYLRILPNCLVSRDELIEEHKRISKIFEINIDDNRFFHQYKVHNTPVSYKCHQSRFRPYLSEVDGGTVYPCDSVVLNEHAEHFHEKFQLCKAKDVLDFIDRKITPSFNPTKDCTGCVFHKNISMLDTWKTTGIDLFHEFKHMDIIHEEFV